MSIMISRKKYMELIFKRRQRLSVLGTVLISFLIFHCSYVFFFLVTVLHTVLWKRKLIKCYLSQRSFLRGRRWILLSILVRATKQLNNTKFWGKSGYSLFLCCHETMSQWHYLVICLHTVSHETKATERPLDRNLSATHFQTGEQESSRAQC